MSEKTYSTVALGIRLGVFAAIAALLLAVSDVATRKARDDAKNAVVERTMKAVLPSFETVGSPIFANADTVLTVAADAPYEFTPVYDKTKQLIAFAAKASSLKGYGGKVTVMFGIAPDGTLGIVNVVDHSETPGLGTVETDRVRQKTIFTLFDTPDTSLPPNVYLDQFNGMKSEGSGWKVVKDGGTIKARTGATVTMRAITDAVSNAVECYAKYRETILSLAQKESIR